MRSKNVRNGALIGAILILILLLALGIGLAVSQNKPEPSQSTEAEPETMTFIQEENETADWKQEEFKDETTDKAASTNAAQKGGSETLGIVPPTEAEDDKGSEDAETNWLDGIW